MKKKIIYYGSILILFAILIIIGYCYFRQSQINVQINNAINSIYEDEKYQEKISISGVGIIKQKVDSTYAVMQLFGNWADKKVTEQQLYDNYNKIVTSSAKKFEKEMNIQFAEYTTTMYKNLTNTELIDKVYESLKQGIPVPFKFAALLHAETEEEEDIWTMQYAIITGIDIPNNTITVSNPYGYTEKYQIQNFLKATRYESYENMPFHLKLGFDLGIYEKNTIFIVEKNR